MTESDPYQTSAACDAGACDTPMAPKHHQMPPNIAPLVQRRWIPPSLKTGAFRDLRHECCYLLVRTPTVSLSSVSSMLNRPKPIGLVSHLTIFPDSAASVPEANLYSAFQSFRYRQACRPS